MRIRVKLANGRVVIHSDFRMSAWTYDGLEFVYPVGQQARATDHVAHYALNLSDPDFVARIVAIPGIAYASSSPYEAEFWLGELFDPEKIAILVINAYRELFGADLTIDYVEPTIKNEE